jgi:uncharacterized membrane protein
MTLKDWFGLIHPFLAIIFVFPLIGIVSNLAWQTRQRRLQTAGQNKSKIAPGVGGEHVKNGRWLTFSVVGVSLIALAYSIIFKSFIEKKLWQENQFQVIFIVLMFFATLGCLLLLDRANTKSWRAIFATLTGMGLIILGAQDGVFRRTNEWYISHYYFGIAASLLMLFSRAIVQDIYQDRSHRWRYLHTILNCLALLLFIGQAFTGSRDIFEIGLYTPPPV